MCCAGREQERTPNEFTHLFSRAVNMRGNAQTTFTNPIIMHIDPIDLAIIY
jgi:hypothetical protein